MASAGPTPDPRVFFAAERTLLAWVRTGITVIALGFVVSRFGLFLRVVASTAPAAAGAGSNSVSSAIGIALVVLGSAVTLGALYNHSAYIQTLGPADVPRQAAPWLTPLLTVAVSVAGLFLAVYLAFE